MTATPPPAPGTRGGYGSNKGDFVDIAGNPVPAPDTRPRCGGTPGKPGHLIRQSTFGAYTEHCPGCADCQPAPTLGTPDNPVAGECPYCGGAIHTPDGFLPAPTPARLPKGVQGDFPCIDCGTSRNVNWLTRAVLWDTVMHPDEPSGGGVICIPCFAVRAHASGVEPRFWTFDVEPAPSAPTPSGDDAAPLGWPDAEVRRYDNATTLSPYPADFLTRNEVWSWKRDATDKYWREETVPAPIARAIRAESAAALLEARERTELAERNQDTLARALQTTVDAREAAEARLREVEGERDRLQAAAQGVVAAFIVLENRGVNIAAPGTVLGDTLAALRAASRPVGGEGRCANCGGVILFETVTIPRWIHMESGAVTCRPGLPMVDTPDWFAKNAAQPATPRWAGGEPRSTPRGDA